MKRLWTWVSDNSSALQGLVALLAVITVLLAMPSFVGKLFRPDVLLRYRIVESTTPPDLVQWIEDINREVNWRRADSLNLGKENAELTDALRSPVTKKLDAVGAGVEKFVLELVNQSEFAVSGAKLRIDNVLKLWGADAKGTFLTVSERANLLDEVTKGYRNNSVILSSLPTLPPEASLELVLYGSIKHSKPTLNVIGHTSALKGVQQVEDSWLLDLYLNPWKFLIWFPLPIWIVAVVFFAYLQRLRRLSIRSAVPSTLYDTGCQLAKKGRAEEAMVLLRQAVESGYSNRAHARQDVDLESLRNRVDFQELFSEPKEET